MPHSKMGRMPSLDVRNFVIPSKNPLELLTQGSYLFFWAYQDLVRRIGARKKKLLDGGSCSCRLASIYTRCAGTALTFSGNISVARSWKTGQWSGKGRKSETTLC